MYLCVCGSARAISKVLFVALTVEKSDLLFLFASV